MIGKGSKPVSVEGKDDDDDDDNDKKYTKIRNKNNMFIITGKNRKNYKFIIGKNGYSLKYFESMYKVSITVPRENDAFNCIIIKYDNQNKEFARICAMHIRDIIIISSYEQ